MLIDFTKMHGLGNDFVVIDAVTQNVQMNRKMILQIADRHQGIGCDQILIIQPPSEPDIDFDYRIFNSNGSEVEQCGNGARCVARLIGERKLSGKRTFRLKTKNRIISVSSNKDKSFSVDMGHPSFDIESIPFNTDSHQDTYIIESTHGQVEVSLVSMGNPHAVIFTDNVLTAPVSLVGRELEQHTRFPEKINVGFAEIVDRQNIRLRVFERDVGETSACGSGACAAAAAAIRKSLIDQEVTVHLQGGKLHVSWKGVGHSLIMSGPAVTSFHGRIAV
jgi:diaminopimelate epimerase